MILSSQTKIRETDALIGEKSAQRFLVFRGIIMLLYRVCLWDSL